MFVFVFLVAFQRMFNLFCSNSLLPLRRWTVEFFMFKNIIAVNVFFISGEFEDFRPSPLPFFASQFVATVAGS